MRDPDFTSEPEARYPTRSRAYKNCSIHVITSEREARSEFLLIYTKNLSMSGRPARRPAGPPAVVTLLGGLYLWKRKPD